MRIYLVRHGVTTWNQKRLIQGQRDVPLAPEGILQAREAAAFFARRNLKKAYCSDLSRALETARLIARPLGLEPLSCRGLREINMGNWEGLSWAEVRDRYPDEQQAWIDDPVNNGPGGGESLGQAAERFKKNFQEIASSLEQGEESLIVTHGLVIGTLIAEILEKSIISWREYSPENTTISEIEVIKGRLQLQSFNRPI